MPNHVLPEVQPSLFPPVLFIQVDDEHEDGVDYVVARSTKDLPYTPSVSHPVKTYKLID